MARTNAGVSLLRAAQEAYESGDGMPIFYFVLQDNIKFDFLDYLAEELKAVSTYGKPILVIDSMNVNDIANENSVFWTYLMTSEDMSLNISARSISALFNKEDMVALNGNYSFKMIILESDNTVENLTEIMGQYNHIMVSVAGGVQREILNPIPKGKYMAYTTSTERRLRLRQEDTKELGNFGCYLCDGLEIVLYSNMRFD